MWKTFFFVAILQIICSGKDAAPTTSGGSMPGDPKKLPLIQHSDLIYLGAFALPAQTMGTSRFGYGGMALSPYYDSTTGAYTLFAGGHAQHPGQIAQVRIPTTFSKSLNYADLPVAKFLQGFADISDGNMPQKARITSSNGAQIYGMIAYHNRLIAAEDEYYGCEQNSTRLTHGVSSLNLALTNDFKGYFGIGGIAVARAKAGPMTEIPPAWQALLGGTVLTGNWSLPIISCNSAGPALTAFNPDQLGGIGTVIGTTLLYYPIAHPLCAAASCVTGVEATTNNLYNLASQYGGVAFPSGFRSVLLFGRQGTGPYCYGIPGGKECPADPANSYKGPHAYPYRYQVWAYDANDLLAVKNGLKNTYDPRPYAIWRMTELDPILGTGAASIQSAGYDSKTRRWYVTVHYGEKPRVDVYQIRAN